MAKLTQTAGLLWGQKEHESSVTEEAICGVTNEQEEMKARIAFTHSPRVPLLMVSKSRHSTKQKLNKQKNKWKTSKAQLEAKVRAKEIEQKLKRPRARRQA